MHIFIHEHIHLKQNRFNAQEHARRKTSATEEIENEEVEEPKVLL